MGWNFRRSLRLGPLKINLSKSGVGYSVGLPGVRLGTDAKGRKYQSLNIPGTGIYRRDYASPDPNWKFDLLLYQAACTVRNSLRSVFNSCWIVSQFRYGDKFATTKGTGE
jgi:hypothetical protein